MGKRLSIKEREQVVTKGYLEDTLDKKDYVTKDFLRDHLEKKDYATKDFVTEAFETYQADMKNHINALMEENRSFMLGLIDSFNGRFERIERHVNLEPWGV